MVRLLRAIRNSILWVNAKSSFASKDYSSALKKLEKIQLEKVPVNRFVEYLLLKGFVLFCLEKLDSAADCFELIFENIEKADRFNKHEKRYILAYAAECYISFYDYVNNVIDKNTLEQYLDYRHIDLKRVRDSIREDYPLRSHPMW